jgi:hypothetical protein
MECQRRCGCIKPWPRRPCGGLSKWLVLRRFRFAAMSLWCLLAIGLSLASGSSAVVLSGAVEPLPGSRGAELDTMSCTSPSACTAVESASGDPLVERWNGSRWSIEKVSQPHGVILGGVACTSSRICQAVGTVNVRGYDNAVVERWNGSKWSVDHIPQPPPLSLAAPEAGLDSISCSGPHECTAVGFTSNFSLGPRTLIESWDGRSWTIGYGPYIDAEFPGVSCPSRRTCVAVGDLPGYGDVPAAEHGSGEAWKLDRVVGSSDGSLDRVSCWSSWGCVAVGSSSEAPLLGRWNGTGWKIHRISRMLLGISCSSARDCVAVGSGDQGRALVSRWNGVTWSDELLAQIGTFTAVSCPSASTCIAVGSGDNGLFAARFGTAGPEDSPAADRESIARSR